MTRISSWSVKFIINNLKTNSRPLPAQSSPGHHPAGHLLRGVAALKYSVCVPILTNHRQPVKWDNGEEGVEE